MLAQSDLGGGVAVIWGVILYVAFILPLWAVLKKAGSDMAWAAFIPILNVYETLRIVGRPGWWLILFLIPLVNIVVAIIMWNDLSKSFGKDVGFTIGLIFLSWIFLAILGWGSASYRGPAAASGGSMAPVPPPPA